MEEILKISEEALNRYFITLSQFGYRKYSDVDRLLVLLFLEKTLSHDFLGFITEEDYKVITDSLYCLAGSNCMINFPTFANFDSLIHKSKVYLTPRITEDNTLRICEKGMMRVEA